MTVDLCTTTRTWDDLRLKLILESPSPFPKCAGVMWSDVIDRFYDQPPLASARHRAHKERYGRQETSGKDCGLVSKRGSCENVEPLTLVIQRRYSGHNVQLCRQSKKEKA